MGREKADQHHCRKSRQVAKRLRPPPPPPTVAEQPDGGDAQQDEGGGLGTDGDVDLKRVACNPHKAVDREHPVAEVRR